MSHRDYEEFLASLNEHGVKYLIIGAHAVSFHARPRATKDLDIFLDPSPENAERTLRAIRDFFGGNDLGFSENDLVDPESIIQLGVAPVRIDLLASTSGGSGFEDLWRRRIDARYGDVDAHYISLDDLIREKRSTDREQDRADVVSLERARKRTRRKTR